MATVIETKDLETLFTIVKEAHMAIINSGAKRVITELKIDDRRDKNATIDTKLRAINIFRTIYYLPSIFGGSVATALLWRFLFVKEGTVNTVLGIFGIPEIGWLSNPKIVLFTLSLLTVWQFGSSMVLFLAGLQQIPNEFYEAAKVDGASKVRTFFRITIPLLSPIIFFNLIMQTVNAFQEFTAAFVITERGPLYSTYLYVMKLYFDGFTFFKMGYASAMAWIFFLILLIITAIQFLLSKFWVSYDEVKLK